jgi:hypothetical protein
MLKKLHHRLLDPLQHKANPLHVYCRLVELGIMSERKTRFICKIYDKLFHRILYPLIRR